MTVLLADEGKRRLFLFLILPSHKIITGIIIIIIGEKIAERIVLFFFFLLSIVSFIDFKFIGRLKQVEKLKTTFFF